MNENSLVPGTPPEPIDPSREGEMAASPGVEPQPQNAAGDAASTSSVANDAERHYRETIHRETIDREETTGARGNDTPVAVASSRHVPPNRRRGWGFRVFFGVIILGLASALAFLSTPYAGEALNFGEAFWGNWWHGQDERQAAADLEALGVLVVYQTGTGNVESINYQGRVLQPDDLVPLLSLRRLLLLDLRNTGVSDEDLRYLKNLSNLATLVLSGTTVTDEGLAQLTGLRSIEALHLTGTAITNRGLAHLKKLSRLSVLDLSQTEISDEGMRHLVGLTELRWLLLSDTAVTDRGIEVLSQMKNLRRLTLLNTQTTPGGIRQLEEAVPGISVDP